MIIRKNTLQLIFSGACLWRWNDHIRPVNLSELDKQGHKMLASYMLWLESAKTMTLAQSSALAMEIIEGALADYLYRLIITDIKPPVFYKIKENWGHYRKLTEYVLAKLEPSLSSLGPLWERIQAWHLDEARDKRLAGRILDCAHLYASSWEFGLIRPYNAFDEEMDSIASSFEEGLARFQDLPGAQQLLDRKNALGKFASRYGQLRFQIRWTQAPRMPATSVLGHMFMVAVCSYLFSLSINACPVRACNNFFSGLFHDLPELLTRDIISPVKNSFAGLSQMIREYEERELETRILEPLRRAGFISLVKRIGYFLGLQTGSEFQDCIMEAGLVRRMPGFAAMNAVNDDSLDPKDGELLKLCDLMAAFMEAHNSISNGVSSPMLVEARARLKREIVARHPERLKFSALLADFD